MTFLADLHIHSRFSLATSKELSPSNLAAWAIAKGIRVIGTGDVTHPKWRKELSEQLVYDPESGLYKLAVAPEHLPFLPESKERDLAWEPLFCLQCEISSVYKKNGRVRKIHNLIYVPTLEDAERFSKRLEAIGNLAADGRPTLGLAAHDLLEVLLETVPGGVLIPAHIWTPWFSLFGSHSGFDAIEECFEDLTPEIFALETGLSSDPPMNRYVSALDRFALISNSDAHSGNKLGREANVFSGTPSYTGMFTALKTQARREPQDTLPCRFQGTLEFFPEEGKYHFDGHRACQISWNPLETRERRSICPVCHKPVTIGVLHRVLDLADRRELPTLVREPSYASIMPLLEITSELLGHGVTSAAVVREYGRILTKLGPEMDVLWTLPLSEISAYWDLLGEACTRLRKGAVRLEPGYDGEFGHVRLFSDEELGHKKKRSSRTKASGNSGRPQGALEVLARSPKEERAMPAEVQAHAEVSSAQKAAIEHGSSPALVLAGPGAGKTHLLMERVHYLLEHGLAAADCLAITFTRRASEEMRTRLCARFPKGAELPQCDTLHAFAWKLVQRALPEAILLTEEAAFRLFCAANPDCRPQDARILWERIALLRERCSIMDVPDVAERFERYQAEKARSISRPTFDFAELLTWASTYCVAEKIRYAALLVDEIQDCSQANLALIRALLPKDGTGFFGIGDPDQSIYGFRGAVHDITQTLRTDWPTLQIFHLTQSFRSSQRILTTAEHVLGGATCGSLTAVHEQPAELSFFSAPDASAEATAIAQRIAELLGASSHSILDRSGQHSARAGTLAPDDIAVLVRYRFLLQPIAKKLAELGIPYAAEHEDCFWTDPMVAELLACLVPGSSADLPFARDALPPPKNLLPWVTTQPWCGYQPENNPAFKQLCRFWEDCGSWENFFDELAWREKEAEIRQKSARVRLMTLHAAKGLEFTAVFMPGFEEGLLPSTVESRRALGFAKDDENAEEALAEEKRLCYVGITRARDLLVMSRAESRTIFGRSHSFPISSFWTGIQDFFQKSVLRTRTKVVYRDGSLL